jgi:hypothetical protein
VRPGSLLRLLRQRQRGVEAVHLRLRRGHRRGRLVGASASAALRRSTCACAAATAAAAWSAAALSAAALSAAAFAAGVNGVTRLGACAAAAS